MKKHSIILTLALFVFCASNISCADFRSGIKPSKNFITRNYKVADFDKLDISTVGDVQYTQSADGSFSVSAYGPENMVEMIEVSNENGTLAMKIQKKKKIRKTHGMKIVISSPELQSINFAGVGDFTICKGLKTPELRISDNGVGNFNIEDISCQYIKVNSHGVGNVNASGVAERAVLETHGVGNIDAQGLKCEKAEARAHGIGNISCFATNTLSASTHGIGNISYGGNPEIKKISTHGIGRVSPF